jgi:excinuclease ABC subunit B
MEKAATREAPAPRIIDGDVAALITRLEKEMKEDAAALDFETAARLRDELFDVRAAGSGQPNPDTRRRRPARPAVESK